MRWVSFNEICLRGLSPTTERNRGEDRGLFGYLVCTRCPNKEISIFGNKRTMATVVAPVSHFAIVGLEQKKESGECTMQPVHRVIQCTMVISFLPTLSPLPPPPLR